MAMIDIVVLPGDAHAFSFSLTPKDVEDVQLVATVSGEEHAVLLSKDQRATLHLGTLSPGRHTVTLTLKPPNASAGDADSTSSVDRRSILLDTPQILGK
jgi:hypothetical protein